MKMKRLSKLIISLLLLVFLFANNVLAVVGWYKDGDRMTYINSSGYKIANAWRESDGMKFYLDEEGYVVYGKVFDYNGKIYCVDKHGARVNNSFVEVTSDMILGESVEPGLFYFSDDGVAFMKNENNFIKNIDGKKYAFDEFGHVLTDCWLTKDGEVVDGDSALVEGYYHVKEDGTLNQNEWYDFTKDNGSNYDMGESSSIADPYEDMNGLWMYFDNRGVKLHANEGTSKKLTLNGNEYSFDENGIMFLGFQKNKEDIDTHQASNPTLLERIKVYDPWSGALYKNKWIYDATPKVFSEDDYNDGKEYWFYIDSQGAIIKNKIRELAGRKYAFDGLGRLRKGFILTDGTAFYGAEYKAEDLSREDFIYSVAEGGKLYGSDLLDIRYFTENEDDGNEGKMVTGNIYLELADGRYEFNFRSTGVAYGNRNELKFFRDTYYRNGIKFVPWEETKYGIVKVADDEYRVINSNGRLVKARKKVLKDDYDNYIIILNDRLAAYVLEPSRKVKLRWKTIDGITGYYFYDMDLEKKAYTQLVVESGTSCPTQEQIADIPKDLRVNFR